MTSLFDLVDSGIGSLAKKHVHHFSTKMCLNHCINLFGALLFIFLQKELLLGR